MRSYSFFTYSTKFFLIIAVSLAVIFFTGTYWRDRCVTALTYPLLCIQKRIITPVNRWLEYRKGVAHMHTLAQQLLEERNALLRNLIELKGTHDYLVDSRECREFQRRYASDATLVAHILLQHRSETAHYLFVDAGENRGIKKDMVVVSDTCLVGRVSEVYQYFSKVMLISDKECHVAASCVDTSARGIHTGLNSSAGSVLEFVSHLDTLQQGDLVISQGEGLIFPRGFGLGRVKAYELDGVQYRVQVEPLIDFSKLTFCLILTSY
jgi:rod shape-determining protein MreC